MVDKDIAEKSDLYTDAEAEAAAPVQSVNSQTGNVTVTAPVDQVNGQTGDVTLTASDVNALADTYSAPVQSVNSQTGDVTISTGGGAIPSTQTVTSYSDLPLTDLSEAEIWFVTGEGDIVASTQLSPVEWRSLSDFTFVAGTLPDARNLQARYDATEISSSDGNTISTWSDATGNGNDLTAGTAPIYKTSAINGNSVVRFDGSNDYLDVTWSNIPEPYYIWVVFVKTATGGNESLLDAASDRTHEIVTRNDNQNFSVDQGTNLDSGFGEDNNAHIIGALFESALSGELDKIRIDGTQQATGDIGTPDSDGLTVGAAGGLGATGPYDVGEILFYHTKPTVADVDQYLSDKWGVTF